MVYTYIAQISSDFARFKDFARIFRDVARIFTKSKVLGCGCTPASHTSGRKCRASVLLCARNIFESSDETHCWKESVVCTLFFVV